MRSQDFTPQAHVDSLFESARNMFEHNELDLAEALLGVIVKKDPHHASAHEILDAIRPAAEQTYYVDYDFRTGLFKVVDGNGKPAATFETIEEAERYARMKG